MTLHPKNKLGVNIDKEKYILFKNEILKSLLDGPMSYEDLKDSITRRIAKSFEGSVSWYVVTVKLDLEARGEIIRITESRKHLVKLKG